MRYVVIAAMIMFAAALFAGLSDSAYSSDLKLKYHINATGEPSSLKAISVAYEGDEGFFRSNTEAGYWADHRPGGQNSFFGMVGFGVRPVAGPIYIGVMQNFALISNKDAYLGGNFQFVEEASLGVLDEKSQISVGGFYKHVSSAGIFSPNMGKDFLGIQVGVPW